MIRNVIFDWSGTLVDDLPAVWKATNFVLAQAERPEMTLDQFRAEFCLPFTQFYDRHVPHIGMAQLEQWFHAHFRAAQASVMPLPHARDFLEFCRERGLKTFVLSTVHPDYFEAQSIAASFGDFIDKSYTGILDKRKKIHRILQQHALNPDETLFIGDMHHDIETARHGGVHSCAVLTGYNTLDQLRAAEPDLIVEHLGELRGILQRNKMEIHCGENQCEQSHPPVVTVGALIFNDAGHLLLVRTHKWSNLWGIPGGKIKRGETCEDALRREIKEETNLDIDRIKLVMVQDCIHSREFYRDAHFVLLNYTCVASGRQAVALNEEAREFRWLAPDEMAGISINEPTKKLLSAVLPTCGQSNIP